MSLLPIRFWPDPCLKKICAEVEPDDGLAQLAQDMLETMYQANGRGLAAPQVGILKRLFVMDCGWKAGVATPVVCINPKIIRASEAQETGEEGCLSIPNLPVDVSRPTEITLQWQRLDGTLQQQVLSGFEAKCAQHELDHLNGIVLFDHVALSNRVDLEIHYQEQLS